MIRKLSPADKAAKTRARKRKAAYNALAPCGFKPKPEPDIVWTKDRRMICGDTPKGRELYALLIEFMGIRDGWLCCICGNEIIEDGATFEHTDKRGGGHRNDQPEYWKPNGEFVKNGVAHAQCNLELGSVRKQWEK